MFFAVESILNENREGRVFVRRERWVSGAAVGGGGRCDLEEWSSGCDVELLVDDSTGVYTRREFVRADTELHMQLTGATDILKRQKRFLYDEHRHPDAPVVAQKGHAVQGTACSSILDQTAPRV